MTENRTTPTEADIAISNGKILKPTVRIETLSPTRAAKILDEQNLRNRDLRESRVAHLAGIITRGEWRLSPDAITFDVDGILLNGQHRLAACGAADIPIEVIVLRNLPRANQDIMDDTLSRKLADALKLRGATDVNMLAAGINWSARLTYAEITGYAHYRNDAARPSIPQLLEYYSNHPGIWDALVKVRAPMRALKLRPGPSIAVRYRLDQVDVDEAALFFDSLRSGADLSEGSPILALRRYSENERDRLRRKSAQPDFKWVAAAIKAWNAWREGRSVNVLQYNYTPLNKEQWPEPV